MNKLDTSSLVQALQMKPSTEIRAGRFVYSREDSTGSENSQAGCSAGNCGAGACSNGFF